jgi:hypothetical protein
VPPESQQNQQKKKTGRPRKFDDAFRQAALALAMSTKFGFSRKFRALGRPLHELTALWNKRQYAGPQQIETGTAIHLAFDQL